MNFNERYFSLSCDLDLSLVIAVYNEEAVVSDLLALLNAVLRTEKITYEIIIVDDGSSDGTLAALREHLVRIPSLRVIELHCNVGQFAAISAGMSVARGAWILMMDGDLQHDPADIPRFLAERESGADLIASYREKREENSWRKLITAIMNRLNRLLLGVQLRDFGSAYRLIRNEIILLMKDRAGYVHYNTADLFIKSRRYIEIPIVQGRRKSGSSKWTLLMFVMFNLDILVTAMRPVLLAVWGSLLGVVVGIALYVFHLVGATSQVQALTGPVSIILLSLQMFVLCVILRQLIRERPLMLGTPSFLIRAIYSNRVVLPAPDLDRLGAAAGGDSDKQPSRGQDFAP
jgi:glycosyltransferase involved in cell wall biosynthesis